MTERLNRILNHNLYKEYVWKTREAEQDRKFCRHDMRHFLDVARLSIILNEKEGLGEEDELDAMFGVGEEEFDEGGVFFEVEGEDGIR